LGRQILLLSALLLLLSTPGFAQQTPDHERTLLFLNPSGTLYMANVSTKGVRIPQASLAPGKQVRRFRVSPDGRIGLLETANAKGVLAAWTLDLASRRSRLLGQGLLVPNDGASPFAPDGRRVALRHQNRDEVVILSANTGQVLHTLSIPGICEAPAWFGDARHIAVPTQLPTGRSAMAIWDAVSGSLRREALKDATRVRFRYETRLGGRLIYRETREGVDRWMALTTAGEHVTDEPPAPRRPRDLPRGASAVACPEGPWLAYIHENALYVRYSEEGAEPVMVGPAVECHWKPGMPLPEQILVSQATAPPDGAAPAVLPDLLALKTETAEAVEGTPLEITWESGPQVAWVRLSVVAERARLGGARRGVQTLPIARAPAARKRHAWSVPWIDNIAFVLRAEPMDASFKVLGRVETTLSFRPRELAEETRDGIFIHLSERTRQRLYTQAGGRLTAVYLCSGASSHQRLPLNQHPDAPHDHYGTFRIRVKDIDHVSNIDPEWKMPYAMGYLNGHYIHQTSRNQYRKLGRPASHGCVRLHGNDAAPLFRKTAIGDLVVIY
jgi:hypothetical protein